MAVFADLYKKNTNGLLIQENKLITINKNLADEVRERKASEEKVKDLNYQLVENITRLESSNKELDRVVFMASHDLQEPAEENDDLQRPAYPQSMGQLIGEQG